MTLASRGERLATVPDVFDGESGRTFRLDSP
jgi:hypothetical protein